MDSSRIRRQLSELAKKYNMALLAVERNNHGSAVLACLESLNYPYVFTQKGQQGWLTSAASRPKMIENLGTVLLEEPERFRSRRFLNECRTFVRLANGNTGAAPGTHDDCVIALAIAWEVRKEDVGRKKNEHSRCVAVTVRKQWHRLNYFGVQVRVVTGLRPVPLDKTLPPLEQPAMPTEAVQHVKRMRGGAQSHLMRCDDGHYYVVKFRNNPQHERVLANEFLATRLAERVGLPVPAAEVVEVKPWLVEHTAELTILLGGHSIQVEAGLQLDRDMWSVRWRGKFWITSRPRCWTACEISELLQEF